MSISIQKQIEYALMAGASYQSNRKDANKFPIPQASVGRNTLRY